MQETIKRICAQASSGAFANRLLFLLTRVETLDGYQLSFPRCFFGDTVKPMVEPDVIFGRGGTHAPELLGAVAPIIEEYNNAILNFAQFLDTSWEFGSNGAVLGSGDAEAVAETGNRLIATLTGLLDLALPFEFQAGRWRGVTAPTNQAGMVDLRQQPTSKVRFIARDRGAVELKNHWLVALVASTLVSTRFLINGIDTLQGMTTLDRDVIENYIDVQIALGLARTWAPILEPELLKYAKELERNKDLKPGSKLQHYLLGVAHGLQQAADVRKIPYAMIAEQAKDSGLELLAIGDLHNNDCVKIAKYCASTSKIMGGLAHRRVGVGVYKDGCYKVVHRAVSYEYNPRFDEITLRKAVIEKGIVVITVPLE